MTIGSLFSDVWSWVKNTVKLNNNESEEGEKENDSNTSEVSQTIINKENKNSLENTPPLPQEGPSIGSKESPSKITSGNEYLSHSETNTSVGDTTDDGNKEKTLTNISDIRNTLKLTVDGLTGPYAYAGKWYTKNISSESSNKVNDINSGNIIGDSKEQSVTEEEERAPVIGNEETKIKPDLYKNNKVIITKGNYSERINQNTYFNKYKSKKANPFTAQKNYILGSSNVKNSVLHETAYDLPTRPRERLRKTIYEKYGLTLKDAPDDSPREAPSFGNSFNDPRSSKSHRRTYENKFKKYDLQRNHRDIQFASHNYNPQMAQNPSNSLQGTSDEMLK